MAGLAPFGRTRLALRRACARLRPAIPVSSYPPTQGRRPRYAPLRARRWRCRTRLWPRDPRPGLGRCTRGLRPQARPRPGQTAGPGQGQAPAGRLALSGLPGSSPRVLQLACGQAYAVSPCGPSLQAGPCDGDSLPPRASRAAAAACRRLVPVPAGPASPWPWPPATPGARGQAAPHLRSLT